MKKLNICLVSDFFCPNTGGVESHIYYLGQCLIGRGHKVIVVTHAYGKRRGIRFLSNALKVYYLPFIVVYNSCILPTVFASLPILRQIFLKEQVQIVHGHSSFSVLAHEAMFHAQMMGLPTVFTDHSLFGFADLSSILTNKLLQFITCNCDHIICVSHTSKENTVLRARLNPRRVSVIPNAIYSEMFTPGTGSKTRVDSRITIVTVGRLVYRRGADLMAAIIPQICSRFENVDFLVGGDGPKRIALEEMRDKHQLHHRVTLLGSIPHTQVPKVMTKGQIYLNCSLTEAFCMTIVEAASCGLFIVSTRVGGIPEVLPDDMIRLMEPTSSSVFETLCNFIDEYESGRLRLVRPENHSRVRNMYYWPDIACRTEIVYDDVLNRQRPTLNQRLKNYFRCGPLFGIFFACIAALDYLFVLLLNRL